MPKSRKQIAFTPCGFSNILDQDGNAILQRFNDQFGRRHVHVRDKLHVIQIRFRRLRTACSFAFHLV